MFPVHYTQQWIIQSESQLSLMKVCETTQCKTLQTQFGDESVYVAVQM